jgi:hypothetical protein
MFENVVYSGTGSGPETPEPCTGKSYSTVNGKTSVCINNKMVSSCTDEGTVYSQSKLTGKRIICKGGLWVSETSPVNESETNTEPHGAAPPTGRTKAVTICQQGTALRITMMLYNSSVGKHDVTRIRYCNYENQPIQVMFKICKPTPENCATIAATHTMLENLCVNDESSYIASPIENVTIKIMNLAPGKVC